MSAPRHSDAELDRILAECQEREVAEELARQALQSTEEAIETSPDKGLLPRGADGDEDGTAVPPEESQFQMDSQLAAVRAQASSLQSENSALRAVISDSKREIAKLQAVVKNLQGQIAVLRQPTCQPASGQEGTVRNFRERRPDPNWALERQLQEEKAKVVAFKGVCHRDQLWRVNWLLASEEERQQWTAARNQGRQIALPQRL